MGTRENIGGYSYGCERNLVNKRDSRLIPYDDLPDFEKEYDRRIALETVKFIVNSGFEITRKTKKY